MRVVIFFVLTMSACLSNVLCFNQTRITDECLKGLMLTETESLKCITEKGVSIQMVRKKFQVFYCVKYEKKTGNINTYDLLSFDLKPDYELKFTGANVVSNDELNPQFKLYDTRMKIFYKGKFAFSSENSAFDINGISINDEEQTCLLNKKQVWPILVETIEVPTTIRIPVTTTLKSSVARVPEVEILAESSCGTIKRIDQFNNFVSLPSLPGQFPWTVAIFRYFGEEGEESYLKCLGTIIDDLTILTSTTCLLEDGFLLKPNELQVHISPFSLSAKKQKSKIFNVFELKIHEYFLFQLEHNIAVVKLKRNIEFNDYVQPICLPQPDKLAIGKLGKFAGFGKTTSTKPPKSDLLTEAEYQITTIRPETFNAENISGNCRISDIGGGFYSNETNRWVLNGIMSKKLGEENIVVFTRIDFYLNWINDPFADN